MHRQFPDADEKSLLRRYVAVFERLGMSLRTGVASERLADRLYGSRLAVLLNNTDGRIKETVKERGGRDWENFICLWKRMRTFAPSRNLPDID